MKAIEESERKEKEVVGIEEEEHQKGVGEPPGPTRTRVEPARGEGGTRVGRGWDQPGARVGPKGTKGAKGTKGGQRNRREPPLTPLKQSISQINQKNPRHKSKQNQVILRKNKVTKQHNPSFPYSSIPLI